jgi:hypothetical protein
MIRKKISKQNLNLFKSETNLGPRNKNMYAMKCNLSNYSNKNSATNLGEIH